MSHFEMTPDVCRRFANTVTGLGGTVPDELAQCITDFGTLDAWHPEASPDEIRRIAQAGNLTPAALTKAAAAPAADAVGRTRNAATLGVSARFAQLLTDGAADQTLTSLRPTFDTAADVVRSAATMFSPDTTAEQVLELGVDAAEVWRQLAGVDDTLTSILGVVQWLTIDDRGPELFAGIPDVGQVSRRVDQLRAAFLLPALRGSIDAPARALDNLKNGQGRGGIWLGFAQQFGLTLNTVTQARAILDAAAPPAV